MEKTRTGRLTLEVDDLLLILADFCPSFGSVYHTYICMQYTALMGTAIFVESQRTNKIFVLYMVATIAVSQACLLESLLSHEWHVKTWLVLKTSTGRKW